MFFFFHSAVTSTAGLVTESQDTGGMRPAQTLPVSMRNLSHCVSPILKLRKVFISLWATVLLHPLKPKSSIYFLL